MMPSKCGYVVCVRMSHILNAGGGFYVYAWDYFSGRYCSLSVCINCISYPVKPSDSLKEMHAQGFSCRVAAVVAFKCVLDMGDVACASSSWTCSVLGASHEESRFFFL